MIRGSSHARTARSAAGQESRGRGGCVRSIFPPPHRLFGDRVSLSGCDGTSRTRRRSRSEPNAAGWHDRSVPDTDSSRGRLWFACSSAQCASHTTPQTAALTTEGSSAMIGQEGLLKLVDLVRRLRAAQTVVREEGSSCSHLLSPPAHNPDDPPVGPAAPLQAPTPALAADPTSGAAVDGGSRRGGER